ncbi:serine/threonine-protein kinase [Nonomuraea sp. CA-143628]|uniref:serine/threonine-protein kinase n=1 Tax=Nonomuraea sp. CA-143628 TaxID=3239997 RepID=UPI003D8F5BC7
MSERRSLADGRYVLESEPVGSGGMGTVWRGYDQKLRRTVAVKELHLPAAGLSAEEQARLRARAMREARAIARLEHPGIVGVYDVLEEDGRPWIVMRFIAGRSLDQEVRTNGPLDPRRAAEIGSQVLDALSAAHDEGVLHLDVKPQNVLLDGKGRAVLTDFGIALVADATATVTASLVGTVGYIAPERLDGSQPGPAADLWSLGATLYFAVEGRPAYAADNVAAALVSALTRAPEPMTRAGALAPTIAGLLEREARVRLDAADAGTRLRAVATATQVLPPDGRARTKALPAEVLDPPSGAVWKRRTAVAAGAAGVALLLAVVVVVLPSLISQDHGNAGRQQGTTGSPAATRTTPSVTPSPMPTVSPSPTAAVRYTVLPGICTKVVTRARKIIPKMDGGEEDTPVEKFDDLVESRGCRWSTKGYWYKHPWAADVVVKLFRFSTDSSASAAFEEERTDFYKNAMRLDDYADELCLSNPSGKDYGYAHAMFREDNLLVEVSYEMLTKGSPAPAVARPRGRDLTKYVYRLVKSAT